MIFSRGRGAGKHAKAAETPDDLEWLDSADEYEDDEDEERSTVPAFGPYDANAKPPVVAHLDLGALRIPAADGVEVRMQAANDGTISQVILVHEDSVLQLGVFAAPRSDGIWDEIRAEIRKQLLNDGVAAEESKGEYGIELRARVRTPDGLTDLRFVGVDRPRWMVQAVFQGPVATDPSAAQSLVDCLRGLVVDRGHEAMPVREPLPLRLPRDVAEQAEAAKAAQAGGADGTVDDTSGAAQPVQAAADAAAGTVDLTEGDTVHPTSGVPPRRKPSPRPKRR